MIQPSNNMPQLSAGELNEAIESIIAAFDIEMIRTAVSNERLNLIMSTFTEYYYSRDLHTFFVLENIRSLTENTMKSTTIRDFTLSFTDRASILLSTKSIDEDKLRGTVVQAICRNRVDVGTSNVSLLVPDLNDSFFIRDTLLNDLLKDNFWLLVVYLVIVYFQQTSAFKQILND
jgi:hypothetical protein